MNRSSALVLLIGTAALGCANMRLPFQNQAKKSIKVPLWAPFETPFAKPESAYHPDVVHAQHGIFLTLPNDRWRAVKDAPVVGVSIEKYDAVAALYVYDKRDNADVRIFVTPNSAGPPAFIVLRAARSIPSYLVGYTPVEIASDGNQAKFVYKDSNEARLFMVRRFQRIEPLTLMIHCYWNAHAEEISKDIHSIIASIRVSDLPPPSETDKK